MNAANQTNKAVCVCATRLVHSINQTTSVCGLVRFKQAAKQHYVACIGPGQVWTGWDDATQAA